MKRILILLFFITNLSQAQILVEGYVVDELDAGLPFAHISVIGREGGVVSSSDGYFKIPASEGDTLLFSFVGYKRLEVPVLEDMLNRGVEVKMAPDYILLPSLWVYSDNRYLVPARYRSQAYGISGLKQSEENDIIRAGDFRFENGGAGTGEVPTFGVGLTFYGPFTFFSEKEIRKAQKAFLETKETIIYQRFINRMNVRDSLKSTFSISDMQLEKGLLALNQRRPDIQKLQIEEDIWYYLLQFFDRQKRAGRL